MSVKYLIRPLTLCPIPFSELIFKRKNYVVSSSAFIFLFMIMEFDVSALKSLLRKDVSRAPEAGGNKKHVSFYLGFDKGRAMLL